MSFFAKNKSYLISGAGLAVLAGGYLTYNSSFQKVAKAPAQIALPGPQVIQPFTLVSKEVLTHDTRRYKFALQSPDHILVNF
jgi:cytochrome-b5 reductase